MHDDSCAFSAAVTRNENISVAFEPHTLSSSKFCPLCQLQTNIFQCCENLSCIGETFCRLYRRNRWSILARNEPILRWNSRILVVDLFVSVKVRTVYWMVNTFINSPNHLSARLGAKTVRFLAVRKLPGWAQNGATTNYRINEVGLGYPTPPKMF